jgi:hypothetical protein
VGPITGLYAVKKTVISCLCQEFNPRFLSIQALSLVTITTALFRLQINKAKRLKQIVLH